VSQKIEWQSCNHQKGKLWTCYDDLVVIGREALLTGKNRIKGVINLPMMKNIGIG